MLLPLLLPPPPGVGYDAVMSANNKLVLTASSSSDAAAVFIWSVSQTLAQLADSMAGSGATLVVPPNALASDALYTFTVNTCVASKSITVAVSAKPASGSCAPGTVATGAPRTTAPGPTTRAADTAHVNPSIRFCESFH
jgi:hypothetical protein